VASRHAQVSAGLRRTTQMIYLAGITADVLFYPSFQTPIGLIGLESLFRNEPAVNELGGPTTYDVSSQEFIRCGNP
jgi:hypothetical protein